MAPVPIRPDERGRVEPLPMGCRPSHVIAKSSERLQPVLPDPIRIDGVEVRERDDGRHRVAGPFDDDPLACGSLIDDLAELRSDLQGAHDSHGVIISL